MHAERRQAHGDPSNSQFQRKAFSWHPSGQQEREKPARAAPAAGGSERECPDRIFEVIVPTTVVRAEPHVKASMKCKKSRGGRVICGGVSMNGWLKLVSEPGWLASHMRGMGGVDEVARLVEEGHASQGAGVSLAVQEYQPQGMCCLEVAFDPGVPVRESPSRTANAVATRKRGEYVFATLQNFDGWVRLANEEGWMLASSSEKGELLRPRRETTNIDLWALSDAWAAARKRLSGNDSLSSKDVQDLKELEKKLVADASALYDQYVRLGKKEQLVGNGFLAKEDLSESAGAYAQSEAWIRQRLFAGVLAKRVREDEATLSDLMPGFALSARQPPLPEETFEEEEEGYGDTWGPDAGADGVDLSVFEGTTPFEYEGRQWVVAPNGVIFEPPNQVPIGIWNPDTNTVDPAAGMIPGCPYAAISYYGKTYLLMPDDKLLDPDTQAVVGTYNASTNELHLQDGGDAYDPLVDDGEPVDVQEYVERGHQMAKKSRWKAAAALYGEALKGCAQTRAVDVDFECEILRARANCWCQLGNQKALLADANRILECNGKDEQAKAWKTIAEEGQEAEVEVAREPARKVEKCIHCNGVAQKCLKCGAGMERCAYCSKPVSRANCCSRCHCTYYCDRSCQRTHWKVHKLECQACDE